MTSASSRPAVASGPSRSMSASVPSKWRKATVTRRCSESGAGRAARPATPPECPATRSTSGSTSSKGTKGRRGPPAPDAAGSRRPWRRRRRSDAVRAAVSGLITISPASAVPSMATTVLAPGPVTMNSRCESPTRKKWKRPLWTPTDIRRETRCPSTVRRPTTRKSGACRWPAREARASMGLAGEDKRRASPPNLSSRPPLATAMSSRETKHVPMVGGELLGAHLAVLG